MPVPFLNLRDKTHAEKKALHAAFERVLESGNFILGAETKAFEKELGIDIGLPADNVIGCNSGTDALVLALKAIEAIPGSEVIVPAFTATATVASIRAIGAIPRFADIDPDTWVMDPADALSLLGDNTKAIIPVHLYGNSVSLNGLESVRNLVIEDVAQAQGASYYGRPLGTWGRAGAYSFYPTKNLGALGDGGAVMFPDSVDAAKARKLMAYGQASRDCVELDRGINSRLDELQAAFLRTRLSAFRNELGRKTAIRELYLAELAGLPVTAQKVTPGCLPAWHLFVIAFETPEQREHTRIFLEKKEIGCLVHYPIPNHRQKAFFKFNDRPLPKTESLSRRILSLPFHGRLSDEDVVKVAASIRNSLRASNF